MKSQTYMSVVDKYLLKHAKGEMITAKMLEQSCRLTHVQASRYIQYCIRIGLGKACWDGIGHRAFTYTPAGDQRVKQIAIREDALNEGRKLGKRRPPTYTRKKLEEFKAEVEAIKAPKPYTPPQVYAADPVMLEKLDVIASGIAHLSKQIELMVKAWS